MDFLVENNILSWQTDKYGPVIYHYNMLDGVELSEIYPDIEVYSKFRAAKWDWLKIALTNIANENDIKSHTNNLLTENDEWQLLPIDREFPEYEKSIEAAENALKEIEGNNGYASTEPDERNAMVHTIRGTINALKDGTPSLEQVKAGLLKPLQYLSKKFADSAIGAAAKTAVAELIKWLL